MNRLTITGFLLVALFFGTGVGGIANAADLDKGWEAYQKGDYQTALREFKPFAQEGHSGAQFALGVMYANGDGVQQDDKQATQWWHLAAEQGHAGAQYNLGRMYQRGKGVSQNYKQAAKWYRLAAEQGDAIAQYSLGVMYRKGEGVAQDYKQAAQWFKKAAEQGYAAAQYNLGLMYAIGDGVPEDNIRGHMWLNIATSARHDKAIIMRGKLEKHMSANDIKNAQTRAQKCVKKNYKKC